MIFFIHTDLKVLNSSVCDVHFIYVALMYLTSYCSIFSAFILISASRRDMDPCWLNRFSDKLNKNKNCILCQ